MKKYFPLLFAWMFASPCLNAQTAEAYFHREAYTFTETVTSLGNNIFLNHASSTSSPRFPHKQHIWKMNPNMQLVDSLDISGLLNIHSPYTLVCPFMKETGPNEVVAIFNEWQQDSANNLISKMYVVVVDSMLNVRGQFSFSDTSFLRLVHFAIQDDTLYYAGFMDDLHNRGQNRRAVLIKSTKDGTWTDTKTYTANDFGGIPMIFYRIHFHGNELLVSYGGGFGNQHYARVSKDLVMGQQYTPSHSLGARDRYFSNYMAFIDVPDSLPVLVGTGYDFKTDSNGFPLGDGHYFSLGTAQLNPDYSVTTIDTFPAAGFEYEYVNPGIYMDGIDYRTADSVIIVMPGYQLNINGMRDTANNMFIYNFNAVTGKMNWMKEYVNGYAHSLISAAEALPGNRFLIALNEYNWDKYSYHNSSIHLMLLDGDGNFIGGNEHAFGREPLTLYPMPFTNHLRIEGLKDENTSYSYKIYEMSGREITSGKIDPEGVIGTENIPKGSFILQISNQHGVIRSFPVIGN